MLPGTEVLAEKQARGGNPACLKPKRPLATAPGDLAPRYITGLMPSSAKPFFSKLSRNMPRSFSAAAS